MLLWPSFGCLWTQRLWPEGAAEAAASEQWSCSPWTHQPAGRTRCSARVQTVRSTLCGIVMILDCSKYISNCGRIFLLFGSKGITDYSSCFCIFHYSLEACVFVFSRHWCSAVRTLRPWIRRSCSGPLTVWCCCWGKKMRCTTVLVCQQVWIQSQIISTARILSVCNIWMWFCEELVFSFFVSKIILQFSYCFSPNERV